MHTDNMSFMNLRRFKRTCRTAFTNKSTTCSDLIRESESETLQSPCGWIRHQDSSGTVHLSWTSESDSTKERLDEAQRAGSSSSEQPRLPRGMLTDE